MMSIEGVNTDYVQYIHRIDSKYRLVDRGFSCRPRILIGIFVRISLLMMKMYPSTDTSPFVDLCFLLLFPQPWNTYWQTNHQHRPANLNSVSAQVTTLILLKQSNNANNKKLALT